MASSYAQSPAEQAKSEYVDPAVCATCHDDIAATYRKTGMGRSFYRPTPQNIIEDYAQKNTLDHKPSGMSYTMVEHDGKFFQRRHTIGFDGKETNMVEEQVDYIIGSGNHARTYLHRTAQGKLTELPVSWYTERSGSWAMSPGYDRANQEDIHRTIPLNACSVTTAIRRSIKRPIKMRRPTSPIAEYFPQTSPRELIASVATVRAERT